MRCWWLALTMIPTPLLASAGPVPASIPADFDLAALETADDDPVQDGPRWRPVDEPVAEPPARLRLRGTRVKIRVPIG